jgi:hypothetical protein
MKLSPLFVTAQQPVWLRLPLTVAFALASAACVSGTSEIETVFAWAAGYFVLTGIPWVVVRNLPEEHPTRSLLEKHEQMAKRSWANGKQGDLYPAIGLGVALVSAHGWPDLHDPGPYVMVAIWLVMGMSAKVAWHFKRHVTESSETA